MFMFPQLAEANVLLALYSELTLTLHKTFQFFLNRENNLPDCNML